MAEDRKEPLEGNEKQLTVLTVALTVKVQSHVDTAGVWIKKAGKLRFGYKKHVATDEQGLIRAVITTPANEGDIVHLEDVVAKSVLKKDQGSGQIKDTVARVTAPILNPMD